MFDDATLRAARNMRFVRIDGQPITERHPFTYIWEFDAGFTTFEMMQAQFITRERDEAQRLLQDLAELCPARYPRADDEINRALADAPRRRPLPTDAAPVLPVDVPAAIELTMQYGECAFSSWEQLKDKRAYHAAARLGWFDQSIYWRGRFVLCERAVELGLDQSRCRIAADLEDEDREIARRWIAGQYGEGYQQLIARRAAERGTVVQLAPETREAIAAAKAARGEDQRTKPIAILSRALKRAKGVDDRAMLQLALARVHIDLGSGSDAQTQIDAVIGNPGSPWYAVQMARVLSLAVPPRWRWQRNDLDATLSALNRELGTGDRLAF